MSKYTSFDKWFDENGFDENFKQILIVAWNAGVVAVCDYFDEQEGTTYGAEKQFLVEL